MAIQSLFGPSPAEVQELRRQQEEKEILASGGQFGAFAPLYQAGLRFGAQGRQAMAPLMGAQDPMLQKATAIQSVLAKYQDQDPSDPLVLTQIGRELMNVDPDAGFRAIAMAREMTSKQDTRTSVLPPGALLVDSQGNILAEGKATKSETDMVSTKVSNEWVKYQELLSLGTPEKEARSIAYKTNATDFRRDLEVSKRVEKVERQEQQRASTIGTIDNVMNTVDKAMSQVSAFTAGALGTPLSFLPGTSAKDLEANLTTIKANLGFDRLQQMRDASPTGGALGQVAVQELVALQSTIGSLDNQQSPKQLRQNLEKVKYHYSRWRNAVTKAQGQQTIGTAAEAPVGVDAAVWNVMTPEERALWQK
jgi:hypothetical protein